MQSCVCVTFDTNTKENINRLNNNYSDNRM